VWDEFSILLLPKDNIQGAIMTISTLILVLLLTFGAACALDRLARSHRLYYALARAGGIWRRGTDSERKSTLHHLKEVPVRLHWMATSSDRHLREEEKAP
jgi:uncharacterized membrane protein YqjE